MTSNAILHPTVAMVAVTAIVWVRLLTDRVGEMRERRIPGQAVATSRQIAEKLTRIQSADNFKNLFEMPVLFYALCLTLTVSQSATPMLVAGAWLFVGLRALHSVIQCGYNRVNHRFAVYLISSLLLFAMWGVFAVEIILVK